MKIDFSKCVQNLDGSAFELVTVGCQACGRPLESVPATLRKLCSDALVRGYRDQRGMPIEIPGDEAGKRYALAVAIVNSPGPIELSAQDITLIQNLVVKAYTSALIVAQVWAMLEPKKEEDDGTRTGGD